MCSEEYTYFSVLLICAAIFILLGILADSSSKLLHLARNMREFKHVDLILDVHRFYQEYMARLMLSRRFEVSTSILLFIEFQRGDPRHLPQKPLAFNQYLVLRDRDSLMELISYWIHKETKPCGCLRHMFTDKKFFKYDQRLSELLIVVETIEDFIHANGLSPDQIEILEYFTVGRIAPSLRERCCSRYLADNGTCIPYLERLESIYSVSKSKPISPDTF